MEPAELRQATLERLHVLEGIMTATERRAELLDLVDDSRSADEARARLQAEWGFTEIQATAALDLQVRRFARAERDRMAADRDELARRLAAPTD